MWGARTRRFVGIAAAALSTGFSARGLSAEPRAGLVVVVSKNTDVDELSMAELTRLYMGDPVDAGGARLIPLNRGPSTKERVDFDRAVLGMSPEEVARYWIDRKIRGQSGAPKAVGPADVYQRVAAKLDGAVFYVRMSELRSDLKVLRINGRSPSERGYPLGS